MGQMIRTTKLHRKPKGQGVREYGWADDTRYGIQRRGKDMASTCVLRPRRKERLFLILNEVKGRRLDGMKDKCY